MKKKEIIFSQELLPYSSFLVFEEMRKTGELCDLTLKIQHSTIMAHRVVLAAGIPYFRSLFTKPKDEIEQKEISMGHLDPNALESLVHFAYCSKINITTENAHALLLASDFLQLSDVVEACVEFLSERLCINTVVEVRAIANAVNNHQMLENCNTFIQNNFEEFSKSEEFLGLPYQCVKETISKDELSISDEEIVFEAVINWVKFSLPEREVMLLDLLSEVRMTDFPIDYLNERVATEELITRSTACQCFIQNVQSFHLLKENERAFLNLNTAPRKKTKKEIYAICSSVSHGYSICRCDFSKDTWHNLKSDKSHKDKIFCAAACNECLYVFLENTVKAFHIKTLEWETLDATHEHIGGSSIVPHGNFIYCFGSSSDSSYKKVRCFDTRQKKWLNESEMEHGRSIVAIASVKESIYVTGGYWNSELFNIAERYNPSTGQWCQLQPMLARRGFHGCANVRSNIYVFGGFSKEPELVFLSNSGEMYDPLTNLWNIISTMRTGRSGFSFAVCNRNIYVFGGENRSDESVLQAEFYDPDWDEWHPNFNLPDGFQIAVAL